ncbi:hypothetical protein DW182_17270 [Bacteroides sp. AM16-24]|nr:hypothetical protein DW182_17270 [Bacteroides sp. AM16-24]
MQISYSVSDVKVSIYVFSLNICSLPEAYLLRIKSIQSPHRGTSEWRLYGASGLQIGRKEVASMP